MSKFRTIGRFVAVAALALAPLGSAASTSIRVPGSAAVPIAVFGFMGLAGLICVLAIGFLIFWIMMVIDCAKREWPEKNTWLIILLVSILIQLHWLAALVYYFTVKRPGVGAIAGQTAPPPQPPAPPATPPPAA